MRKEVIGNCTLYLGDCLEVMPLLGKVDAVVTSPPYNLGGFHQMHNGNSAKWEYDACDDDMPEDEYQDWQVSVCNELFKICTGPMFYSHKNRIVEGILISPLFWLPRTHWTIHQQIVLNKGSGANVDKRRFFPVHENIYVCFKRPDDKLENVGCYTDVWFVGDEQTNRKDVGHPAVMPKSAAERCIKSTTGKLIFDPFMGSGTTGLACVKLGRSFVGAEVSEKYFDIACKRIEQAYKQGDMFIAPPSKPVQGDMKL